MIMVLVATSGGGAAATVQQSVNALFAWHTTNESVGEGPLSFLLGLLGPKA
jgi:hypothetical protein